MKTVKFLSLLFVSILILSSCEEDDLQVVELKDQPSFTTTVSTENSSIYYFENTTPNKEQFYSFYEIEGVKIADIGIVEHQFLEGGSKTVTLTMVATKEFAQTAQNIDVTLPAPDDDRFLFNPENLVKNGYFAEGDGDDFTNWGKNNGADRFTSETVDVHIGYRAVKINNSVDGNPWETQMVTDGIATTDGGEYTVSMWIKGAGAQVRFSTNPGVGGDQYAGDYVATDDWTQYAWTFTANSASTLIALDMGAKAATFVIDGVEMIAGARALPYPSNDSALLNGGLEEGDGDDFTNWGKFNGADRITGEDTDVLSGFRAMKVSNSVDGNPWETQFVSDAFVTDNGSDYTASMWIKGTAQVRYSTNPGVGGDQYGGDYVATAEWTQYSWTFTANSDTTLLALDMGALAGDFVVDNIKVEKN